MLDGVLKPRPKRFEITDLKHFPLLMATDVFRHSMSQ